MPFSILCFEGGGGNQRIWQCQICTLPGKKKFCAEFCPSTQLILAVVQKTSQLAENQHNHCLAPVLVSKLPAPELEPSQ